MKVAAAANQFMITIWNTSSNQTIVPQLVNICMRNYPDNLIQINHHHHVTDTLLMITASNNPDFLLDFEQSSCGNNRVGNSGGNELDDEALVSSYLSGSAINNSPKQIVYTYCNYCRTYKNHCVALFQTTCLPTLSMVVLTLYHLQLVSPTYQGKGRY